MKDLTVRFATYGGNVQAVRGISFHMNEGECLAMVGESGCGKSVTAQTIMGLTPSPPATISGEIFFRETNLLKLGRKKLQALCGSKISMIFQDPMTYLNPTMTVGKQLEEVLQEHTRLSKRERLEKIRKTFDLVGIPNPEKRIKEYPHEFSGGMRQRVLIAMAVLCGPELIIADEPTTALDVTIQAQVLELLKSLREKLHTSVLLITHDLGVVANMADRILVVYAGKVVESGDADAIFHSPAHPYTKALLASAPSASWQSKQNLVSMGGTPPDLFSPPVGCGFSPRCDYAMKICREKHPPLLKAEEGHLGACWLLHERCRALTNSQGFFPKEALS